MQWLAGLEHHQIGDVHHVIDRPHASSLQTLLQPAGRGSHRHAIQGGEAEQAALLHAAQVCGGRLQGLGRGRLRRRSEAGATTAERRYLAGDAPHREAIGPVGGDRQLQHLIIEAQGRTHRLSDGRDRVKQLIQNGDAAAGVGQTELLQRADHAAAGDAAQLGRLDRQPHRGQGASHQRHRHVDAGAHVGGAADNLQHLASSDPHLADAELVGIGMGFALLDVTDDDPARQGREILDLLDFKASDREAFRQLSGLELIWLHLHQFLQPLERDPHRPNRS